MGMRDARHQCPQKRLHPSSAAGGILKLCILPGPKHPTGQEQECVSGSRPTRSFGLCVVVHRHDPSSAWAASSWIPTVTAFVPGNTHTPWKAKKEALLATLSHNILPVILDGQGEFIVSSCQLQRGRPGSWHYFYRLPQRLSDCTPCLTRILGVTSPCNVCPASE
ncbi:uncharacterized protein HMPREF1120_04056 [Exophiala dermatitidis NIH/UT8656]|uniref:Uncharacterized protein n=1 Tax=Exophiala dermatitidis (strain ATCC 34100 / CBS 525.76 / NIH/UT8656) TaxID=858893 RepID=H6BVS1_EXODN|nr:uncharacterized protein HMPREF1120_04056 [Exophiala dermatitidis NIH/UT8656]EHY55947.1 hypothetical protein HMPREF1120_04056 [Exophiala dermatitidis NIH/UT8656]